MDNIRKVCNSLYVSGHEGAKEKGDDFGTVVSLACPCEATTHDFVITDGNHQYDKFEGAVDSIINGLESGDAVLVNCQAGVSRSVSACIAAQVCHYDISFINALQNARFGHRMPHPELMKSAENYINDNYSYHKNMKIRDEVEKEVIDIYNRLESSLDEDEYFDEIDRFKIHFMEVIEDRFGGS